MSVSPFVRSGTSGRSNPGNDGVVESEVGTFSSMEAKRMRGLLLLGKRIWLCLKPTTLFRVGKAECGQALEDVIVE